MGYDLNDPLLQHLIPNQELIRMPHYVRHVPNPHDPSNIKYHVVMPETVVSVHDSELEASEAATALNAGVAPPKAKKAKVVAKRKHK